MEVKSDYFDFLHERWFMPETLQAFRWENEYFLWAIPAIPVFFLLRWLIYRRLHRKLDIALFSSEKHFDPWSLLRFIPTLLQMVLFALILVGLARPQKVNEQVEQWIENIDIMLILDTSSSMDGMDFKPNRIDALKKLAADFIKGRKEDRIGLVVFAGDAFPYAPPTTDYKLLNELMEEVDTGMMPNDGTAIGMALTTAVGYMKDSKAKSKVAILLSDGDNTAGNIDPSTAADVAYGFGVKVYTIGIGKNGKVPYQVESIFGTTTAMMENTFDEKTLRMIADKTDAKFFRATNNEALAEIFSIIDELEKSEVKETRYKNTKDYYSVYLKWAILVFLTIILLKVTFINNYLQD